MNKNIIKTLLDESKLTQKQREKRLKICVICNKEFLDLTKRNLSCTCTWECQCIKMARTRKENNTYIKTDEQKESLSKGLQDAFYNGQYIRNCPECNKLIRYKSLKSRNISEDLKRLCKSCTEIGTRNHFYGKKLSKESQQKRKETQNKNKECVAYIEKVKQKKIRQENNKKPKLTPEEISQKISKALKGKKFTKQHIENLKIGFKKKLPASQSSKIKQSQSISRSIATGKFDIQSNSRGIKSTYYSSKTLKFEHCDSNLERFYMYQLDNNILINYWTKYHGIVIPYIDQVGVQRNYIPDFLIIFDDNTQVIVEIKGMESFSSQIKKHSLLRYAQEHNVGYCWISQIDLYKQDAREWIINNCKSRKQLQIEQSYMYYI